MGGELLPLVAVGNGGLRPHPPELPLDAHQIVTFDNSQAERLEAGCAGLAVHGLPSGENIGGSSSLSSEKK
jgi:hypothetical protein